MRGRYIVIYARVRSLSGVNGVNELGPPANNNTLKSRRTTLVFFAVGVLFSRRLFPLARLLRLFLFYIKNKKSSLSYSSNERAFFSRYIRHTENTNTLVVVQKFSYANISFDRSNKTPLYGSEPSYTLLLYTPN